MSDYNSLLIIIVDFLRDFKAYQLKSICEKYGINCDNSLNPMHSKRVYIESGITKKSFAELKEIAKQIISEGCVNSFVKNVEPFLNDDFFKFSMSTRRMLLDWLSCQSDLEGNINICQLVSRAWDIDNMKINIFDEEYPLKDYIIQHMIRNDDITYEELLEHILDFMYISDEQLIRFLISLVDPSVRSTESQKYYVGQINRIICCNGYLLISQKNIAGRPIYSLEKSANGIKGQIKNIIFGAYDKKPDIVIDDSLLNTLKIVGDENKCLFYDLPISSNGLSWHELVTWWNSGNEKYDIEVEKALVERLKKSLDSDPEITFIRTYYNYIHKLGNKDLPALIPQVYCHYDPKSAKMRNGQVYVHQRMDFLLLLPQGVRVVVEIDGKQHYANDNVASPQKYATMVQDDRELKLYGYDVYRFGGDEFTSKDIIPNIEIFIEKLFKKYAIL